MRLLNQQQTEVRVRRVLWAFIIIAYYGLIDEDLTLTSKSKSDSNPQGMWACQVSVFWLEAADQGRFLV